MKKHKTRAAAAAEEGVYAPLAHSCMSLIYVTTFNVFFVSFFIIFRWSRRCCRALKRPAAPSLGSAPQVTRVAGGGCVHMVPAARYGAYDFDNGGEDDGDDKIMHKTGTWRTTTCSLLVLVE